MKFSMNGFRKHLSLDVENLRDFVAAVVDGEDVDYEELVLSMNRIITHSNVVNCVFQNGDPDFKDMGDLEIDHLDWPRLKEQTND